MVDNKVLEEYLSANIAATKQLAATMAQLADVRTRDNKAAREQTDIGKEMNDVLGELEDRRKKEEKAAADRLKAQEEEIDKIDDLNGAMKILIKNLKEKYKASKSLAVGLAAAAGAMKGFQQGMKMTMSLLSGLGGILQSVIGGLFDIGIAILTGPIKMFNALFSKAKDAMGSGTEVAQAIEKIRENFGDVSTGLGKNVKDMGTALTQGLIAPGLRSMQVFGNLAEAMNYVNELAAAAPAQFQALQGQIKTNTKEILSMAKGLGIAKEDFQGLMNAAISSGTPLIEIEKDMTKYAKGMAKEFGLDSKMISRDMGRAMKDVKHFANVSVKELAKATTYAHGLGLELKDITGVLDAFNTFDQAAENVAKLSQAFGVNIDTMKLLEAKTPDDALDQIKQAFTAAGKSADKMNRQELQLIASTVGMDEASVRQALSTKNAGISMQRAKSASAALEGQTMSTAQAMQVLSKDIEKMVKSAEPPKGENFFEVFFEGFAQGVERTAEFRGVLQNLMKSIWVVRQAGVELGEAFVKSFPGFRDVLGGLADILAPDKIGGLFKSFANTLKEFFASLKDGSMSVEALFKKLQKNVMDYFTAAGPGGQKFLNGLSDMWKAVKFIIVGALDYIGDMLKDGLTRMADYLDNGLDKGINSLAGGVMSEASPIIDAFTRLYEKVKDPILRIINKAFAYIGEKVGEFFEENWLKISTFLIGPALIMGIGQAFVSASSMLLVETIVKPWLKKFVGAAGAASAEDFEKLGGEIKGLRQTLEARAGLGPAGDQAGKIDWKKVKQTFAELMVFVAAGLIALAGVLAIMKMFSVKQEDLLTIGVLVVSMAVLMLTAAGAMKIASSVDVEKGILPKLGFLLGVVAIMLGAAAGLVIIAAMSKDLTGDAIKNTVILVAAVGLLFLEAAVIVAAMVLVAKLVEKAQKEFLTGVAAVGLTVLAMLIVAGVIVGLTHAAPDAAKMQGVSAILDSVSKMFLAASVVVLMSIAIGAIILGTGFFAGGAAAVGLGAIAVAVGSMALVAQQVADKINGMDVKDPRAFLLKTKAVVAIMDAITRMTSAVAEVIDSIPPGIANDTTRLQELGKMITDMLKGIENIIKQVIEAVERIGASDKTLASAAALAKVLDAVASMAQALNPGDLKEIYKSIDEDDFEKIPNIISSISVYAQKVSKALLGEGEPQHDGILKIVESLVSTASKWNEGDVPKIEALANVISSIGSLASALRIPPELAKTLEIATSNTFGKDAAEILDSAAGFLDKISKPMKDLIDTVLDKFPAVIRAAGEVNFTENQAKAVENLGPIVAIVTGAAAEMARAALAWGSRMSADELNNMASSGIFGAAGEGLKTILNKAAESLPGIIESATAAVNKIPTDKTFMDRLEKVGQIIQLIQNFKNLFADIKNFMLKNSGKGEDAKLTDDDVTKFTAGLSTSADAIGKMARIFAGQGGEGGAPASIEGMWQALNDLTVKISNYKDLDPKKISDAFSGVQTILSTLDTVQKMNIGDWINKSYGTAMKPFTKLDEITGEVIEQGQEEVAVEMPSKFEGLMTGMKGLISAMANADTGLPSMQKEIGDLNKIFTPEFTQKFGTFGFNMNRFGQVSGVLKTAIDKIPSDITGDAVAKKTGEIKKALETLKADLEVIDKTINAPEIGGKLELVNGKLELVGKKYELINKKPININITLNAILSVGDIGNGLVKSDNKVKTRIEQLAIRAGVSEGYSAVNDVPRPPSG